MKKTLLISLPIAVVALIALYLFGVPSLQVNNYKATAKANQLALSSSVSKAISAGSQNAFLAPDTSIPEAKNAIKITKDAASDLETRIRNNKTGLTALSELPFVAAVNANYKAALEVKSLEEQYVKASNDYLRELKAVNEYFVQTLPIMEITEQLDDVSAKMESADSEEAVVALINEIITKLEKAQKIASPVRPAESVKEAHAYNLKTLQEAISLMKQMKAAVAAMDMEKLTSLGEKYETVNASAEKELKKLSIEFVEKSKLAKLGDTLNKLNGQIDTKYAEL